MTFSHIDCMREAVTLRRLVGEAIAPVHANDRFLTYKRVPVRQVCWAHLRREHQAMIDRPTGEQEIGAKLLAFSGRLFDWWQQLKLGAIRRSMLGSYVCWPPLVVCPNLAAGRDGGRQRHAVSS